MYFLGNARVPDCSFDYCKWLKMTHFYDRLPATGASFR